MYTVVQILSAARIISVPFTNGGVTVQLTTGDQLMGTYDQLCKFRDANPDYAGWEAHHILESLDVERLGLGAFAPPYGQQICVLLPRKAHQRINSVLRRANPTGWSATSPELKWAYRDAYNLVGNYCGSSEALIFQELYNIFDAVLGDLVRQQDAAIARARGELQRVLNLISLEKGLHGTLVEGASPGLLQTAGFIASFANPLTAAAALVSPSSQAVIGGAVNLFNPTSMPEMSIWEKAQAHAQAARQALLHRDLASASAEIALSRAYFEKADLAFKTWRDNIELAGRRAEITIGVAAAVAAVAAIGVFVVEGAGATATAAAATGTATDAGVAESTETGKRIFLKMRIAVEEVIEAHSYEEEQIAETKLKRMILNPKGL